MHIISDEIHSDFVFTDRPHIPSPLFRIRPEGTYLAWLDCRRLGLSDRERESFFLDRAGVQLHNGAAFGAGGSGFIRMNIACPRSILLEAIARIGYAIHTGGT